MKRLHILLIVSLIVIAIVIIPVLCLAGGAAPLGPPTVEKAIMTIITAQEKIHKIGGLSPGSFMTTTASGTTLFDYDQTRTAVRQIPVGLKSINRSIIYIGKTYDTGVSVMTAAYLMRYDSAAKYVAFTETLCPGDHSYVLVATIGYG